MRFRIVLDPGLAIDMGASWYWPNEPVIADLLNQLSLESFPQHNAGSAMLEAPNQPVRRLQGNPLGSSEQRFTRGAQSLVDALAALLPKETLSLADPVATIEYDGHSVTVTSAKGCNGVFFCLSGVWVGFSVRFCGCALASPFRCGFRWRIALYTPKVA